jgi:hypothetical protein
VTHEQRLHGESAEQVEASAGPEDRAERALGSERIGVGGGDEIVAKLQLAARWAEQYAPNSGDSLDAALIRFRRAYNYLDSVTKLIDPQSD